MGVNCGDGGECFGGMDSRLRGNDELRGVGMMGVSGETLDSRVGARE